MNKNNPKLIIIDGNAVIHRSFHALPPTITLKSGEMVNAVYGFAAVLLKAIKEFKPEYVVLTLDKKGPTFRHKQYKEYKANRVKAPDDLYSQIPRVKEIAKAFDIPIFEISGYEADDLIGTITKIVDGQVEKIIVTGDMDTLQLVNEHTKVYAMSRGVSDSVLYDEQAVQERFGIKPAQMIDFKALRGDPSDNIPGVRGIGEKGATELLTNFKTLDGVYKNIESTKIKDRTRNLLKEHKQDAYMSKELATIKCDVKINFSLAKTKLHTFKQEAVTKIFSALEFKSLLPRVQTLMNNAKTDPGTKAKQAEDKFKRNQQKFNYILVDNEVKFKKFLSEFKKQPSFTFDTETSSFNPLVADLLGISFSWKKGEAYYIKVKSQKSKVKSDLFNYKQTGSKVKTTHAWLEKLKPIFADKKIKKFGHNLKFDLRVLQSQGLEVSGLTFDTMIASYLLNPGTRQHNLDAVTFSELGFSKISKDDLLGKGKDKISFPEIATDKLSLYSCEDADFTNRLVRKLKPQLKNKKLDKLFNDLEMLLIPVLAQMENSGIKLDTGRLNKMSQDMAKKLTILEKKIYKQAKVEFNINSTQQLREILFTKLGIPTEAIKKTKTGLSTAADELAKIKDLHPIIKLIQEYRELTKLTSTYVNALPLLINKETKRLHTSFNQTITATGRLSSSQPNLQNIPVRTDMGKQIRQAFIAQPGNKLISLDYSQIELRLAAHMSNDKKMIKAFKAKEDIHTATAAEINQVDLDKVTPSMRREAKAINFGILYGQGPHGLSQVADIPYFKAKEFIDQYFSAYADIRKFIDKTIKKAQEQGYVETLFNRRRYLPEINSSVIMVRKSAERMAINTPLQGTAADMLKAAMIKIHELIKDNHDIKMLLQVHDELIFEAKTGQAEKLTKQIKSIMENILKLKVPIVVDIKISDNWGEL